MFQSLLNIDRCWVTRWASKTDQQLHRFRSFPRFEAEQQNSQTERDYHRNYHCTSKLFLRELLCHGAVVGFYDPSFETEV